MAANEEGKAPVAQSQNFSEKTLKAIKSVKEMRMQGKDYIICKYYLLSEGFSDHDANEIWHLSKQMLTTKEKAMVAGLKGIYRGAFFIGGIMAVFLYVFFIKIFNIFIATIFALVFLRYSRFAHLMKVTGIAEEGYKSINPFREKDPLEMRWFDYGVISGFITFLLLAYAFPDTFGVLLDSFIHEYTSIESWVSDGSKLAGGLMPA
ncbi:MAG: hypothetical protein ABIG96_05455 [Candidatus Micrarchaeota archaeon]